MEIGIAYCASQPSFCGELQEAQPRRFKGGTDPEKSGVQACSRADVAPLNSVLVVSDKYEWREAFPFAIRRAEPQVHRPKLPECADCPGSDRDTARQT